MWHLCMIYIICVGELTQIVITGSSFDVNCLFSEGCHAGDD